MVGCGVGGSDRAGGGGFGGCYVVVGVLLWDRLSAWLWGRGVWGWRGCGRWVMGGVW